MKLFASVTKGLEDISASEIESIGGKNIEVFQKYIFFEIEDITLCSKLRIVDDVFIKVKRTNYYEDFVKDTALSLTEYLDILHSLRKIDKLSITVSLYKNNKVDRSLIEKQFKVVSEGELKLKVTRDDEADLNLRIIIEENNLFIGFRLFKRPLKDRDYAVRKDYMGSLRPTIAAAIIKMALMDIEVKDLKLVDNFCGSGTFLAESAALGLISCGGDLNKSGVETSVKTLKIYFGVKDPKVFVQDAASTKWKDAEFDIAVSNYPWDSQVAVESFTGLYESSVKEYARILKSKSALGFILTKPDLMEKFLHIYFPNHNIIKRQIGYLGQTPWIIIARYF